MSWNYRVVRKPVRDNDFEFGIHEAYYHDGESKPWAITQNATAPREEDAEELAETILHMYEAFGKPVLDYETREAI